MQLAAVGKPGTELAVQAGLVRSLVDDLASLDLDGADVHRPLAEVISGALLNDLARMLAHEAGTRRGDDAEALHQLRVATRRLRSTLRTFRPLLAVGWSEDLRDRLRTLASALGEVRDLDVQLDGLTMDLAALASTEERLAALRSDATAAGAAAGDRLAGAPFLAVLRARREEARSRLLCVLDNPAHAQLLDDLVAGAHAPRLRVPDQPAGAALAPLIAHAWRRVRKAQAAGAQPHEIRIRIKRLRYAAEAAVPAFGKPAVRLARTAADAQDVLGERQDSVVAEQLARARLRDLTAPPPPPSCDGASVPPDAAEAFTLGLVVGLARDRRAAAEAAWPETWKALRRPKLRRFLKPA